MSIKRFNELHDEFRKTSKAFAVAKEPTEQIALLKELRRIMQKTRETLKDFGKKESQ